MSHTISSAKSAPAVAIERADQRVHILEVALGLLADHGAAGMSMRALASACEMNVATLYHYYPSKEQLVRAAIEHGALGRLNAPRLDAVVDGSVEERLTWLVRSLAAEMFASGDLWRVLVAEALRGDEHVLAIVLEVSDAFDAALTGWLAELAPDAPGLTDPPTVTALRQSLYGMLLLTLVHPGDRDAEMLLRSAELAATFARLAHDPRQTVDAPETE